MDACACRDDEKKHDNSATDVTHLNTFLAFAGRCVGRQGGAQFGVAVCAGLPDLRYSAGDLGV
jgi:hypothetical protein